MLPQKGSCVTAVCGIILRASKFPLEKFPKTWIGNQPRALLDLGWRVKKIQANQLKQGDLIYLADPVRLNRISHVIIAMGDGLVFHCSAKQGGGKIERIAEQISRRWVREPRMLLAFIDLRSSVLRRRAAGPLLSIPIPRPIQLKKYKITKRI